MSGKTLKYKQAQNTNTFYRLIAILIFVIIIIFIVSSPSSSTSSNLIRGSTTFIKDLEDSGIKKFNQYTGRSSTSTFSTNTKKKKKVAYAITVTKDGHFVDGALVLGHSAKRVHDISKGFHSEYDADLVAFVVPGVKYARPG